MARLAILIALSCALLGCSIVTDRDCSRSPDFCPPGYECFDGLCMDESFLHFEEGFVRLEGGTFLRGSPEGEVGRLDRNGSGEEAFWERQHEVTLTRAFFIQPTEVTLGEYREVMGEAPPEHRFVDCGDDCPVTGVSWSQAAAYSNALSYREGYEPCYICDDEPSCEPLRANIYECEGFRLPTDAEWEYAARAGTTTATYAGDITDDCDECCPPEDALVGIAWYCHNSEATYDSAWECAYRDGAPQWCGPQPVGTRAPNEWELFDMLGNVREWVGDHFGEFLAGSVEDPTGPGGSSPERTIRGGSFEAAPRHLRCARRSSALPEATFIDVGFRVVRTARE